MSRVKLDYIVTSSENYKIFCKLHPEIKINVAQWRAIIRSYNEKFRDHILETGEQTNFSFNFGNFTIYKKIRRKIKGVDGKEFVNLAVDWKKTRERGKVIYNFNYHTEGFFFGWLWCKKSSGLRLSKFWKFKPNRDSSRGIAKKINSDKKYQYLYQEWKSQ